MPRNFAAPLILGLATLCLAMACSSGKAGPRVGRYVVSAPKAAFYKYGPAQSFGPDFVLPQGQRLTKLEAGYGFSHVMTDDGTTGFVSNEDIKPAPAELAPPSPTPTPPPGSKGPKRSNKVDPYRNLPPLNMNDVPLPLPESEPPKATPKFRY